MLSSPLLSAAVLATSAYAQFLDPRGALTPGEAEASVSEVHALSKRCEGDVIPQAPFAQKLHSKVKRPAYKQKAYEALVHQLSGKNISYTESVAGSDYDEEYVAEIGIGGQIFRVIIDSGSSDTWLAKEGFKCFNLSDYPEPESYCAFGTPYKPQESTTYIPVKDKNFNISYADAEYLTGEIALEQVGIAGMVVNNQTIGVVTDAAWDGDGISSGLMGLAFPDLTSRFNGTNTSADVWGPGSPNWDPYSPLFFTAVQEGVVNQSYFSLALDRGTFSAEANDTYDADLGYIAFGGIAPANVTNTSSTADILTYTVSTGAKDYFYYTVATTFFYDGQSKKEQAILDSGTTLMYVPTSVAKTFNDNFKPPATFVASEDTYYVDCNATVPEFVVEIAGANYTVAAADQILPVGTNENGEEICISGTQDGGTIADGFFILGDVFFHNVVVTFNPIHEEVTLHQRTPY